MLQSKFSTVPKDQINKEKRPPIVKKPQPVKDVKMRSLKPPKAEKQTHSASKLAAPSKISSFNPDSNIQAATDKSKLAHPSSVSKLAQPNKTFKKFVRRGRLYFHNLFRLSKEGEPREHEFLNSDSEIIRRARFRPSGRGQTTSY